MSKMAVQEFYGLTVVVKDEELLNEETTLFVM